MPLDLSVPMTYSEFMTIVLSPSKNLDWSSQLPTDDHSLPGFMELSTELVKRLSKMPLEKLETLLGVSSELAKVNQERYRKWPVTHNLPDCRQALFSYNGNTYSGLGAGDFNPDDLDFAEEHLRIVSALYGLLRPLDLIAPYRLEMSTSLQIPKIGSLYAFWKPVLTKALALDISKYADPVLLNLASSEYFRVFDVSDLKAQVITPVFQDGKRGIYKAISAFAKKARGLMARWIIKNQITDPSDLKKFEESGYQYCPEESRVEAPVYRREESL